MYHYIYFPLHTGQEMREANEAAANGTLGGGIGAPLNSTEKLILSTLVIGAAVSAVVWAISTVM